MFIEWPFIPLDYTLLHCVALRPLTFFEYCFFLFYIQRRSWKIHTFCIELYQITCQCFALHYHAFFRVLFSITLSDIRLHGIPLKHFVVVDGALRCVEFRHCVWCSVARLRHITTHCAKLNCIGFLGESGAVHRLFHVKNKKTTFKIKHSMKWFTAHFDQTLFKAY